ncbi:alpha beta-hydrolase [Pisolithus orientalis]|uniref:alpha beta-hydrolase n=1 Tax=Pisolithus orientalis TaxID=936130 RepID=UPI002224108E|nr:alpha beta-hydrolase [Pisolithus orientalis]KAI5996871.1 alpha beta-hydrolase [Pisolithus orientalis]
MSIPGLICKRILSDDGTPIYAEAVGNSSLPSIIFIHGLGLSSIVFEKLFQDRTLLNNAYLVRYDLRGHGWSGKPVNAEAHESIRYAQDFMAVADAFNLNKPYLFGWSLGATVATDVCQHISPTPLAGIIYAAPLPYIGPIMAELGKPTIAPIREGLMAPDVATVMDSKIKFVLSTFVDPDAVDYPTIASWIGSGAYISGEGVKRAITRPQNPAGLYAAGKAGLPLLFLYSHEDAQLDNEVAVNEVGCFFENKKVIVIPRSGHAVFHDNQSRVVAEIISFIGGKTAH